MSTNPQKTFMKAALSGLGALIVLAAGLGQAQALNPQPGPPGRQAVANSANRLGKVNQIKLPPDPCKGKTLCRQR
jgi:hypothetical protein